MAETVEIQDGATITVERAALEVQPLDGGPPTDALANIVQFSESGVVQIDAPEIVAVREVDVDVVDTNWAAGMSAGDMEVLRYDAASGRAKGDADFIFNPTLKTITLGSDHALAWSTDLFLYRDAAGVLAQRNGANAQAFNVYNTYTDGSNYERGSLAWSANMLYLLTTKAGSGTGRNITLQSFGGYIYSTGHFQPTSDATYDAGGTSNRWRSGYFGGVAATVPLTIKLHASQSANALTIQNSSGTDLWTVQPDLQTYIYSTGTGKIPLRLYSYSGQTASIQEWRDSSSNVLAKVDKDGKAYGGGASAGAVAGTPKALASEAYVQSRLQNLLTNGSLLLGNNYNFSSVWTFDSVETHGGGGSIKYSSATPTSSICDEFIPVDVGKTYVLSGWVKNGNADGSEDQATATQYYMVVPYDIDQNIIDPFTYSKYPGATDTTLAVELKTGDSTATLTDATGWFTGGDYRAVIAWWPYTNSKGYSYPAYTYTRNHSYYLAGYGSGGTWAAGGISGNVITLRAPWPGPTLPVGTPVRNCQSGGSYKYIALSGVHVPSVWTRYWGTIGGVDTQGAMIAQRFPYGTAYVKVGFLMNYPSTHAGVNTVRWSDMTFMESAATLANGDNGGGTTITPLASWSYPGVIDVRGGTTPQYFRIWNTTDEGMTNGEYAQFGWISNTLWLTAQKTGTGSSRTLRVANMTDGDAYFYTNGTGACVLGTMGASGGTTQFYTQGTHRMYLANTVLRPYTDSAVGLGEDGGRWKTAWLGGTAATVPLVVKLHASQTANALEVQNSSGTVLAKVTAAGYIEASQTVDQEVTPSVYGVQTASVLQQAASATGSDEAMDNLYEGVKFTAASDMAMRGAAVSVKISGTLTNPIASLTLRLYSDNAGAPGTLLASSSTTINYGFLGTGYTACLFRISYALVSGTSYWLVVRQSAAPTGGATIYLQRGTTGTGIHAYSADGSAWTTENNKNLYYYINGRSYVGLSGVSTNNHGVLGTSTTNVGVYGTSVGHYGVQGVSNNSIGVYGTSSNYIGVWGSSTNYYGVYGLSTTSYGVYGQSTSGMGVAGRSTSSIGVYGISTSGYGLQAISTDSFAAVLDISGTLAATNSSNVLLLRRLCATASGKDATGNVLKIQDNPTGGGVVSGYTISADIDSTERFRFDPRVADGGSAVAYFVDTKNSLSTSGAKLLSIRNQGAEKASVDKDGAVTAPKFTAGTVSWTSGSGSPEGVVTAPVGSLYSRTDGGANTTLYVKESGSGNVGWVAK